MSSEIDQIKDRINIVDLVSEYIPLKKAGINHQARCPFHNEKTPSFYVSAERGTFKCFGCGEGGDVFTFVEKMDGLEFREALTKLAQKAGVTLQNNAPKQGSDKKALYSEIMEQAALLWQQELGSNEQVKDYLKKRGFSKQIVQDYRVGFAPDSWDFIKNKLTEKGYKEIDLETVGLIKKGDKGSYYDRFRNRVVFPLFSISGGIVAFSGRFNGPADGVAKYLNSPDTPLFNKSRVLYGMHSAKNAIRVNNFACIVEGQVDLVMSQQVFPNTVATSGTSLTNDHLQIIRRFADRVVFVFDSDDAGLASAYRGALLALAQDFEVKIAQLPEGSDPADVILDDEQKYKDAIAGAVDVFDLFLEKISREMQGREQTKAIEEKLFPLIAAVSNPLERDRYVKHISQKLSITPDALHQRLAGIKPQQTAYTEKKDKKQPTPQMNPSHRLAEILAWQQSLPEDKRSIDIKGTLDAYNLQIQEVINKQINQISDLNEVAFKLENLYQTDIILENEIQEISKQIEKKFSSYTLEKLKQQLIEAEQKGEETTKEQIKKEIANLLNPSHASKKNTSEDQKDSNS